MSDPKIPAKKPTAPAGPGPFMQRAMDKAATMQKPAPKKAPVKGQARKGY